MGQREADRPVRLVESESPPRPRTGAAARRSGRGPECRIPASTACKCAAPESPCIMAAMSLTDDACAALSAAMSSVARNRGPCERVHRFWHRAQSTATTDPAAALIAGAVALATQDRPSDVRDRPCRAPTGAQRTGRQGSSFTATAESGPVKEPSIDSGPRSGRPASRKPSRAPALARSAEDARSAAPRRASR